jgi:hypothetical protein
MNPFANLDEIWQILRLRFICFWDPAFGIKTTGSLKWDLIKGKVVFFVIIKFYLAGCPFNVAHYKLASFDIKNPALLYSALFV